MPRRTTRRKTTSLFAPPGEEIYLPVTYRAGRTKTGQVITRAARQEPAQQTAASSRYGTYLPTVSKTTTRQAPRDYTGVLQERGIYLPVTMRTGETAEEQAAGYTPPQQQAAARAGTTRQATTQQAPPGVDRGWYQAFQQEHKGQTPEEYYGGEYGLAEALADREWSQSFQQQYGRPPSDYDWDNWYYQKTGGWWKMMSGAERRYERQKGRRKSRKAWAVEHGWKGWGQYETAIQEGWAEEGEDYESAIKKKPGEKGPLYVPPQVYWR